MKTAKTAICAIIALAAASSQAFLGFGSSDKKPPKLHVLMQEANDYIEEAQVCELNGDGDKAIEFYKKALAELDKIVAENPERAETAEFAPLRNKAAVCAIQIDAIKLEQVNANERRVAVTDTTELQKKYDAKMAAKRGGAADVPREEVDEERAKTRPVEESAPSAADAPRSNLEKGMAALKAKDYDAVERAVSEMLSENAKDSVALNLLAAAEIAKGDAKAAEKTLDLAISANPGSYYAYYNMARLMVRAKGNKEAAKRYYETGRRYGGPKDAALEGMLK